MGTGDTSQGFVIYFGVLDDLPAGVPLGANRAALWACGPVGLWACGPVGFVGVWGERLKSRGEAGAVARRIACDW